ncbi:hypothetical protein DAPPUDRAFT_23823, partial [Daphnia pulex]
INAIVDRTGYMLEVRTGLRKYGPPQNWQGPKPLQCTVVCENLHNSVLEHHLIPLLEKCGTIWEIRLIMDTVTNLNRGYAFVTFTTTEAAKEAVNQLHDFEMRGRHMKVRLSVSELRLFVGNIPNSKSKVEIMAEFNKFAAGLTEVIIYKSPDLEENGGFCFLEYDSHKSASMAKQRL